MPPHGGAGSSAREAETALLAAARRGTAEQTLVCLARVLETDGADVDARGPGDVTALHAASVRGDPTVAARLVDAGASLVARDGESGWSPLHRAFHHGSPRRRRPPRGWRVPLRPARPRRTNSRRRPLRATPLAPKTPPRDPSPTSPRPQFTSPDARDGHLERASSSLSALRPVLLGQRRQLPAGQRRSRRRGSPASIGRFGARRPPRRRSRGERRRRSGGPRRRQAHSLAATADGSLFAWGHGRGGRLGVDDENAQRRASGGDATRQVPYFGPRRSRLVVAVAAGKHHSIALCDDGEVFSWGRNDDGRLGYATAPTTESSRETVHSSEPSLALRDTPRSATHAAKNRRRARGVASSPSPPRTRTRSWCLTRRRVRVRSERRGAVGDRRRVRRNAKREAKHLVHVPPNSSDRGASSPRPPPSDTRWLLRRRIGECVVFGHGAWSSRRANVAGGLATARWKSDARDPVRLHRGEGARAESSRSPPARRTLGAHGGRYDGGVAV